MTEGCHFAVKGGGHSRSPGDSNAIQGVTLDLARLSDVQVSAGGTSAVVGGGATSAQTYAALEPRNLSFVGGRVGQVGVGGFTLGGGTYPFANKYGWALDNVLQYEVSREVTCDTGTDIDSGQVILANSSLVTASETTNPDLFFALRGGANNFGIVTSFTVTTFPQGEIYVSQPVWSDNQSEAVLDEVYKLYTDSSLTSDLEMGYDLYFRYDSETDQFLMSGTQRYETAMARPPVFEALDQIPVSTRSTRNATLANLTSTTPELGTTRSVISHNLTAEEIQLLTPGRNFFDTLSIMPSRKVLSDGLQIFREEVTAIKSVGGLTPNFICYPLPSNAIRRMNSQGGNALGIDQKEPLFRKCNVSLPHFVRGTHIVMFSNSPIDELDQRFRRHISHDDDEQCNRKDKIFR